MSGPLVIKIIFHKKNFLISLTLNFGCSISSGQSLKNLIFDRLFRSAMSRGRQVTFDKLPVGAEPWPQKIFKKFLRFFGSKKIKVTKKPIFKKLIFLNEKSIQKKGRQICPLPKRIGLIRTEAGLNNARLG